ncbi:FAD synthase [Halobacteriales archaeon QS_1_67_19]|nr:MAG: FAD synthase [Halobacteriales archaeon QS_1_67_19]
MTRVAAFGTFDLLHPGHVHYLREAAAMGEELHVIMANGDRIDHKEPIVPDRQRVEMVAVLAPVTAAHRGDPDDISRPIRRLDPDVIVLGGDQHHEKAAVESTLDGWGLDCEVRRASLAEPDGQRLYSSSEIARRIVDERGRSEAVTRER